MAPAMALVMAPAMAEPMADGWQEVWQNDAPNPNPNPIPKSLVLRSSFRDLLQASIVTFRTARPSDDLTLDRKIGGR